MSYPATKNQASPGKRIGQGMLIFSFVLGLGGLTFFFEEQIQQQANPNQNPLSMELNSGIREVVLQQNRQGHYVASGTVNNVPVLFLLDTGATDVAIPESIALAAGLRRGNTSRASTANGVVTVYSTRIDELTLGNIVLEDVSASITTSMAGNTILLGMSALRQVEFSQRGGELTLRHYPES
ncbi:MAG: retropepsin-like aspartic protease family protein [Pseudomonadales bacterium]|jgi:aspartyl protease family protein|tara:strand:- start:436 stop:981 length:546 start_codon:yes stop_codon:yes gene_type:complete